MLDFRQTCCFHKLEELYHQGYYYQEQAIFFSRMCGDIHRHWKRCDHRDYIQAPFCGDFRRGMNQVNNPYYLNQPDIPYHQTERCRQQTRYENSNTYCTPCSMTQQGWNFRGYASGLGGYPRYF
jgi:hypothetical protein